MDERFLRGYNIMKGITNAEATAVAIDKDGWLHGDMARRDKTVITVTVNQGYDYRGGKYLPKEIRIHLHPSKVRTSSYRRSTSNTERKSWCVILKEGP